MLSMKLAELEAAAANGAKINWESIERLLTRAEGRLAEHYRLRGALESGVRIATQEDAA